MEGKSPASPGVLGERELEHIFLFQGADSESILPLLAACPVKTLRPGEVLIHAAQPNDFLFVVLSGRMRVHLDLQSDPIALIEAGSVVGELSVIDGEPTSAHVVADEECRVLLMEEHVTRSLLRASPDIAYNLLLILAERLRNGNAVISTTLELQREYRRFAMIDGLTGLYNRRWLDTMLVRQLQRSQQSNQDFSILILDLDDFKRYNDTFGHLAGDHVLRTVAGTFLENLRSGEMIARYGGDEFVILLPDADARGAARVGKRLARAVRKARVTASETDHLPPVSLTYGVTESTGADVRETLIAKADAALYRAKAHSDAGPGRT